MGGLRIKVAREGVKGFWHRPFPRYVRPRRTTEDVFAP